jgi:polyisoprenoid-binding protein YceI
MTTDSQTKTTQDVVTPGTYVVDPMHSSVNFVARHLMASKVRGSFSEFEGSVEIGETLEASSVTATVQAKSIQTNQGQRDEHLRSGDFLEVEQFPTLTLVSKKITLKKGSHYDLLADVTVRGVTKEVEFDLELLGAGPGMAPGTNVVGFEATGTIDRRDFGVSFNRALETGGFIVSNEVDLEFQVEASTQPAA